MKQLFTLIFALAFIQLSHAQSGLDPYTFSSSIENTYAPLQNGTPATGEDPWDDPSLTFPIGFTFSFLGTDTETLYMSDDFLGGIVSASAGGTIDLIAPYISDIMDRGNLTGTSESPIVYTTEGNPGSRIFKLEWQNVGFYNEIEGGDVSENFLNFQLWLYEGSNDIEYHFGPSQVDGTSVWDLHDGLTGPLIGFVTAYSSASDEADSIFYLAGVPDNPTLESVDIDGFENITQALVDHPSDGTIYRFSTGIVDVESVQALPGLRVFPQPVTDILQVDLPEDHQAYSLQLFNYAGQEVIAVQEYPAGLQTLRVHHLPAGIYQLLIQTGDEAYSKKVVIQ